MNKIFSILFLLFIIIFTTSIDSLPQRDFLKRDRTSRFIQCPGNFPMRLISDSYSPKVLVPGKNFTDHLKFENDIAITEGVIEEILFYHKNYLLYSIESDFCKHMAIYGVKCPIRPGTHELNLNEPFASSPDQPKGVTDEYLVYYLCKLSNIVSFDPFLININLMFY